MVYEWSSPRVTWVLSRARGGQHTRASFGSSALLSRSRRGGAMSSSAPWHGDIAGNATDGLIGMGVLLLAFCTLSGKWWVLGYAIVAVAIFISREQSLWRSVL